MSVLILLLVPSKGPVEMGNLYQARMPLRWFSSVSANVQSMRIHGIEGVSQRDANLIEVYPGAGWRSLAGVEKLPRKDTLKGREARRSLLELQGVVFPEGKPPSTDQMDAAMAAWTAYCFDNDQVSLEGTAPWLDEAKGVVREGYIVQPAPVAKEAATEPPASPV